jgi:hypothetical protein
MKSDMNTRNSNKFYHFYHDNDHDTDVCHALKKEIDCLILRVSKPNFDLFFLKNMKTSKHSKETCF